MNVEKRSIAADWLAEHPQVRVRSAELLGTTPETILDTLLEDLPRVVDYAEALAKSAMEYGAPDVVLDDLSAFVQKAREGEALNRPYIQKTLGATAGLHDISDIKSVMRDALLHAPSEDDRKLVEKFDQILSQPDVARLESGGSVVWCVIGCAICAEACVACCTILFDQLPR